MPEPPVDRLPMHAEFAPQLLITEVSFRLNLPEFIDPVQYHIFGFYQVLKLESTRKGECQTKIEMSGFRVLVLGFKF